MAGRQWGSAVRKKFKSKFAAFNYLIAIIGHNFSFCIYRTSTLERKSPYARCLENKDEQNKNPVSNELLFWQYYRVGRVDHTCPQERQATEPEDFRKGRADTSGTS